MRKKKALDIFCGGGGVSRGLVDAGFVVTGVDLHEQENYPYKFIREDARKLTLGFLRQFDFIWASPPCQKYTAYRRNREHVKPVGTLIPAIRRLLEQSGVPYVIENVPGAPMKNPLILCGSMFGLDVKRHRLFEASFPVEAPGACNHKIWTPRFAPASNRKNLRKTVEVGAWRIPLEIQQKAMGIDWLPVKELSQAIPPAYSEYIAKQFLRRN